MFSSDINDICQLRCPYGFYHTSRSENPPHQKKDPAEFCWIVGVIREFEATLVAENPRSVPDAVVAAVDVVRVLALRGADRAPMAVRLSPAIHAIGARIIQPLVRPAFGDDLARQAMHTEA